MSRVSSVGHGSSRKPLPEDAAKTAHYPLLHGMPQPIWALPCGALKSRGAYKHAANPSFARVGLVQTTWSSFLYPAFQSSQARTRIRF